MAPSVPLELHHRAHSVAVTARLPGVRLEDVHIALTRDTLTIDAAESHHVLAFACPVDDRRATMHFHDGVLWIHLPKLPA